MKTIQGPGIFLAQFVSDRAPFNTLDTICAWAESLGYVAVQIPSWDARLIDLKRAAESKAYCEELAAVAARHNLVISELSTHLQGQLVACHPAYDAMFDGFAPESVRGDRTARQAWAVEQMHHVARASAHSWSESPRHVFGCAGVAVPVSLAATAGGSYRGGFG